MNRGLLIILSGPSGAGKDTLLARIRRRKYAWPLHVAVTATTRPRRRGEREGHPYHFLPRTEFEKRIEKGWFLEHADVYGHLYGVPKEEVEPYLAQGVTVIAKIDIQGAATLRQLFPYAVRVFVKAGPQAELEARLRARGVDSQPELDARVVMSSLEMDQVSKYDYFVDNSRGRLPEATNELWHILHAARSRVRPSGIDP